MARRFSALPSSVSFVAEKQSIQWLVVILSAVTPLWIRTSWILAARARASRRFPVTVPVMSVRPRTCTAHELALAASRKAIRSARSS